MSDVTRCDYLYNEEGELQLEELPTGRFVRHSDYATLLTSYNALVEAVAWERECADYRVWIISQQRFPKRRGGFWEVLDTFSAARAEVDRLLGEGEG